MRFPLEVEMWARWHRDKNCGKAVEEPAMEQVAKKEPKGFRDALQ